MSDPAPALKRVITLPLLVLYGLGTSIGAGIYVLIGEAAAQAGPYAPMSFVLAAIIMAFTAGSFAELTGRLPQAAGEAIYVSAGLRSEWLSMLTGGTVLLSATVAGAAITLGGVGYLLDLIDIPHAAMTTLVVLLMGGIAIWGVKQSVAFAGIFTVAEVLGLVVIIVAGFWNQPDLALRLPEVVPEWRDTAALGAIFTTSLIAFFAFIGFDDVVNLVEETRNPARTMPAAIYITLAITTVLYFLVSMVAVLSVPIDELGASDAPVGFLYERLTGTSPLVITLIAVVATLNGIILQIIMASRVLYGLGEKGSLPKIFASVSPKTRTPLFSTLLVTATILVLALFFPIGKLAEVTTQLILVVFTLVNLSLVMLKLRREPFPEGIYTVRIWVPVLGTVTCLILLVGPFFVG